MADLEILEVSLAPIDAVQTPLDTEATSATDAEHSLLIEEVKVGCSIQFACRPTSFEEARGLVRQVDEARWVVQVHRTALKRTAVAAHTPVGEARPGAVCQGAVYSTETWLFSSC